jgi:hypothetical protein
MDNKFLYAIIIIVILYLVYKLYELNKRLEMANELVHSYKVHNRELLLEVDEIKRAINCKSDVCQYKKQEESVILAPKNSSYNSMANVTPSIPMTENKHDEMLPDVTNPIENTVKDNATSDSDSDDELMFHTGANDNCYEIKSEKETNKMLSDVKKFIKNKTATLIEHDINTELLNKKTNPFASTFVSHLLNKISENNTNDHSSPMQMTKSDDSSYASNPIPSNTPVNGEIKNDSVHLTVSDKATYSDIAVNIETETTETTEDVESDDDSSLMINKVDKIENTNEIPSSVDVANISDVKSNEPSYEVFGEEDMIEEIPNENEVVDDISSDALYEPANEIINKVLYEPTDEILDKVTDETEEDEREINIENRRKELHGTYNELTVEVLKAMCLSRNIKVSVNRKLKRKEELVNDLVNNELFNVTVN